MVWDAMGAIFGIFAFVLTVFLEWPKLIARVRGIPPILVSIAAALFFCWDRLFVNFGTNTS